MIDAIFHLQLGMNRL